MKRIVMFTNTFEPMVGGLERSVADTHKELNDTGHFCRVVTPSFKGAEQSAGGVLRVPALTGFGEKDFSIPLPTTKRMEQWMEAIEPHIVHAHQPFLLGDTAMRVARLRRVPLVFTHHTFYERYAHYLPFDHERAYRLLINMTTQYANRCQVVIAPTESVRGMLIDRGIHAPIEVAPTGIDLALYSSGVKARGRENFGLRASDEVVGHLGRLSLEKNLAFLVESMLRLMKARSAVKFLLIGDGDRLEWAKAQFAEASMSHRLVAPGLLAGQAIADAYAVMDVFAFTSKTDTQGLVLAEAMAAGVPIVALDAPGARDCVADRIAGLLLPSNASETEFAHVIELLLKDNARRQTLSHGALEASRRFSLPQCVKRLQAIYERASAVYRQDDKKDIDPDLSSDHSDVEWSPFWEKISSAFRTLSSRSNSDLIG